MQIKKKAKNFWNDQASKNDESSSINQESLKKDGTKNVSNDKKIVNNKEIQSYNCKKKNGSIMHLNASPRKFQRKKVMNHTWLIMRVVIQMKSSWSLQSKLVRIKIGEDQNDEWYLDTRCLNYMTGKKSWYSKLDDSINRKIRFADNSIVCVEGIGNVLI